MIRLFFLCVLSIAIFSDYSKAGGQEVKTFAAKGKTSIGKSKKTGFTTIKKKDQTSEMTEFVDKDGTVFAVTWEGQIPQTLYSTLGTNTKGAKSGSVKSRNIVIDRFREGEKVKGRGYLLGALPKGISPNDIK